MGNISYRNITDGYLSDNKAKNNINLRTKIGDIVFNRGEGAKIENEEYLTKTSKVKDEEDNALEKNIDRTEKENKKRKKKKKETNQDSLENQNEESNDNEDQDLEKNSEEEENN